MTSPVGHSLGGYIFAGRPLHLAPVTLKSRIMGLLLIIFAANAPDLDFLYGAIRGDFNAYHHQASHSLMAILIFSLGVWALSKTWKTFPAYATLMAGLAYASHIALDYITKDTAAPFGMQLYWPFSQRYHMASQPLFERIMHGGSQDNLWEALPSIFSMHNLTAIGVELLLLGPLALFVFWKRTTMRKTSH
ncbi:MAG: metal-dependent hydrolase [Arenicellales bacterium]